MPIIDSTLIAAAIPLLLPVIGRQLSPARERRRRLDYLLEKKASGQLSNCETIDETIDDLLAEITRDSRKPLPIERWAWYVGLLLIYILILGFTLLAAQGSLGEGAMTWAISLDEAFIPTVMVATAVLAFVIWVAQYSLPRLRNWLKVLYGIYKDKRENN